MIPALVTSLVLVASPELEFSVMRMRPSELMSSMRSIEAMNRTLNPVINTEVSVEVFVPAALRRPPGEQLAFMILRRTKNSESVLKVMRNGTARASQKDYATLIASNMARKHDLGWLVLTAAGRIEADAIVRHHGREFNLHLFTEGPANYTVTLMCCCGWSTSIPYFSRQTSGAKDRAKTAHLNHVAKASPSIVPDGGT